MAVSQFQILGIPGSLRRGSYNRGLLRAAREVAPEGVSIEVYERLGDIPPYNADVDAAGTPEVVQELKDRIAAVDALLIATPEYNYSMPGVLKNAIDWASRPPLESPLRFKPIAIMGATTGNFGTVRAQLALRQVFLFTESYLLTKPEVHVFGARDKFDAAGNLKDEGTREYVRILVESLVSWAHRLKIDDEDGR